MIKRSSSHRHRVKSYWAELHKIQQGVSVADSLVSARAMIEAGLHYLKATSGSDIENEVMDALDSSDVLDRPMIFVLGRTCEYWSASFAKAGLPISAAEIEERALHVGEFYQVGRVMLLRPDQVSAIFETDRSRDRARQAAISKPRNAVKNKWLKAIKLEGK